MKDVVEEYLERFEVPGAAVAIVSGGEAVLNDGFGVADLGSGEAVTNGTAFAIASVTKAFTAVGVAALVDDGLLEWDAPVRDYLPEFAMHDPVATERLTVRDMLCHRSGLPRHDLVWYRNEELTKQDIVRRLRHLPPSRDLRTTWQYNNLMYSTAGYLCEVLSDRDWEDYIRERVLAPLGMSRTTFSPEEARELGPVAVPHSERDEELTPIPYASRARASGPAGAIYSSGDDMLRWLRVQLDGGQLDGEQVLSAAVVAEMQSPQMAVKGTPLCPEARHHAYGLGWSIGTYRGHPVVHHGGNIDGFTSLMTFLPDEGVGILILTNRNATFVREAISYTVFDRLLGLDELPWADRLKTKEDALRESMKTAEELRPRRPDAPPSHALEEYVGAYEHPGYGRIEVELDGDGLVGSMHAGHITLTHRHYDVFDLAVEELPDKSFECAFRTDLDGSIGEFLLAAEPTVAPIVFRRLADDRLRDPEFLALLAGRYTSSALDIEIQLRGDALVLRAALMSGLELEPLRGTTFRASDAPGVTVTFEIEDGASTQVIVQPYGAFTRDEPAAADVSTER